MNGDFLGGGKFHPLVGLAVDTSCAFSHLVDMLCGGDKLGKNSCTLCCWDKRASIFNVGCFEDPLKKFGWCRVGFTSARWQSGAFAGVEPSWS